MSCTLDLWTDTVKNVSYISITIHYIDEDFVVHDRTLRVKTIRDASHTAITVLDEFTEGLELFDLHYKEYALDRGSNRCGAKGIPAKFLVAVYGSYTCNVLDYGFKHDNKDSNGVKGKPLVQVL